MCYKMRTLTKLGAAMSDRDSFRPDHGASAPSPGRQPVKEIEQRAARLNIQPERVLREYIRIAFARITDIVEWNADGEMRLTPSSELKPWQVAAIAEIVAAAGTGRIYRIKMHDKKPVLDAIARYLGMFPKTGPNEDNRDDDDGEDPREFLAREIASLRAGRGGAKTPSSAAPEKGSPAQVSLGISGA